MCVVLGGVAWADPDASLSPKGDGVCGSVSSKVGIVGVRAGEPAFALGQGRAGAS